MAGLGKRFSDCGYNLPKPLLPLGNKTMIEAVLNNLNYDEFHFTVIVNRNQVSPEKIMACGKIVTNNFSIVDIDYVPKGPADSASLALPYIDPELPLVITNCDQMIEDFDAKTFLKFCSVTQADGVVGVFHSSSPKNSYVCLDSNGEIIEVKEKEVISNIATNGFHWWRRAAFFSDSLSKMKQNNQELNGEFYVAPSYNNLAQSGMKILPYWFNLHYPIGTPRDYEHYKTLKKI